MLMQLTFVMMLNGTNYDDWANSLRLYLVVIYFDLALREDQPTFDANSIAKQRVKLESWTHLNRFDKDKEGYYFSLFKKIMYNGVSGM